MSRPHEDRERHTLVDHTPGGDSVAFNAGSWVTIGVARVKSERNDASVSAYETLIEHARTSSNVHAGAAAVFAAADGRRVVTMVGVRGHDGFHHLQAAWDDHHRFAEHRAISESVSFELLEVAAVTGDTAIDPSTHDIYVFERIKRAVSSTADLFAALGASDDFRGAIVFVADGANGDETIVLTRFAHIAEYETVRAGRAVVKLLGAVGDEGESSFPLHPRKTFALTNA